MAQKKMTRSKEMTILTAAGGLAFWVANFAISLTPIAAGYRAALSISYVPMLLESLFGGLVLGFCVSRFLVRFYDKIPTRGPISKSLLLSSIVLIAVTMLMEAPAKFLTPMQDALGYFLTGTLFNVIRILALGIVTGYLYGRLHALEPAFAKPGRPVGGVVYARVESIDKIRKEEK